MTIPVLHEALHAAEERIRAATSVEEGVVHVQPDAIRLAFSGLAVTGSEALELATVATDAIGEAVLEGESRVDATIGMILQMLLAGLLVKEPET